MVSIRAVDPHHDDEFRAAYDVLREGVRAGRTAPLLASHAALRTSLLEPSRRSRRSFLAAYESDAHTKPLGVALLDRPTDENSHLAELEIAVPPRNRSRGVGSALFDQGRAEAEGDDRSTFICEVFVEAGLELEDSPGGRFALARGYRSVHEEDHLVLDLPAALPDLEQPDGYRVVSWRDRCPDDLLAAYADLRTAMEHDHPTGELDVNPTRWGPDRVRENEARMSRQGYVTLVSAAQRADGELGGYTLILVPADGQDVYQDDTLVASTHRRRGLGRTLKIANMSRLTDAFPDRTKLHTWTAGVNGPMQAINGALGFRLAERMHEVQRADASDQPDT